jgi:hypothetical protein
MGRSGVRFPFPAFTSSDQQLLRVVHKRGSKHGAHYQALGVERQQDDYVAHVRRRRSATRGAVLAAPPPTAPPRPSAPTLMLCASSSPTARSTTGRPSRHRPRRHRGVHQPPAGDQILVDRCDPLPGAAAVVSLVGGRGGDRPLADSAYEAAVDRREAGPGRRAASQRLRSSGPAEPICAHGRETDTAACFTAHVALLALSPADRVSVSPLR